MLTRVVPDGGAELGEMLTPENRAFATVLTALRFVLCGVGFGWASRHWRVIGVFPPHENHDQSCLRRWWVLQGG
jgi:hypothetical protein